MLPALIGFHSGDGIEYKNVFLKHDANGPFGVPGIQEFFSPHHPHLELCTQAFGFVVKILQSTCIADRFKDPS